MATYGNIAPLAETEGVVYATAKAFTGTEADLYNGALSDPIVLPYEAAIAASVQITVTGGPSPASIYVVMQTDMGDGVWVDVAWALCTATSGTSTFWLSAGVAGSNAFAQTRAVGTAPSSSGSNQCCLGRVRFVGKATLSGGTSPAATVTIRYKKIPLR